MTQPLNENQLFMSTVTRVNCNLKCYMIVVLLKKKRGGGGGGKPENVEKNQWSKD